jgi:hypothetical protein
LFRLLLDRTHLTFPCAQVSACGVDLGSSLLFGRARLGFSGTPNNLTPTELGRCIYEPGSDGLVVHVLTSPEVGLCLCRKGTGSIV